MQCEKCSCQEATIHLTQVVDGKVKKLHLCESCAQKSGFDLKGPMSITDILLGLGKASSQPGDAASQQQVQEQQVQEQATEKSCQTCSMTPSEFRRTGRLGCPDCYMAFQAEIMPLLKAMHRSQQHIGKVPHANIGKKDIYGELADIQKQLEDAVATEAYEKAAALRDQLQRCKAHMNKKE